MKLEQLAQLTKEMVSKFEEIDGYLFIDRFDEGKNGLIEKVIKYDDPREAQRWMNIVLIDQSITTMIGEEWEMDDKGINDLLTSFEEAWAYQAKANFPGMEFNISRIIDDEYGDLGLRLTNEKFT